MQQRKAKGIEGLRDPFQVLYSRDEETGEYERAKEEIFEELEPGEDRTRAMRLIEEGEPCAAYELLEENY